MSNTTQVQNLSSGGSPGSLESDAMALLALKSSSNKSKSSIMLDTPPIARLETRDFEYLIRTRKVTIGRNSSSGTVDVSMGNSSFISRRHIEIRYEQNNFWLSCLGKNGVFIDGTFYRKGPLPRPLERKCTFRFPSTHFRVWFESLVDDVAEEDREVAAIQEQHAHQLKINIPLVERQFPPHGGMGIPSLHQDFPSPTGTIR